MTGTQVSGLTSTTAPGKVFSTRSELADHYKSEWHKYNLKRREAGLPMLQEQDFQARWEAALAMRKDNKAGSGSGNSHIKAHKQQLKSKKKQQHRNRDTLVQTSNRLNSVGSSASSALPYNSVVEAAATTEEQASQPTPEGQAHAQRMAESQENPVIDPKQSLFDPHTSQSVHDNVKYMEKKYGFFLPDREYLADLEGLLGYCQEKIKLGHFCLYCEKVFPTWQGCQKHMISKNHTKLRYEKGHWDELDVFYDFSRDDEGFLGPKIDNGTKDTKNDAVVIGEGTRDDGTNNNATDDEDGWEDMSEDGDDDDDELYRGYEEEIARFGLNVSPLGEIVFPDGRIIGHRALRKYYNQRARPAESSVALVAAKRAAGERLYEGRVVNIASGVALNTSSDDKGALKGAGRGILVRNGEEGFSSLSLYRFRAAIRKQRRGDEEGRRLKYRQSMNINKMDKKHNRLMNGVSVAHAAR